MLFVRFSDLVKLLEKEVDEATDPVYGKSNVPVPQSQEVPKPRGQNQRSASSFVTNRSRWPPPCAACNEDHIIIFCEKFKQMSPADRVKPVRKKAV